MLQELTIRNFKLFSEEGVSLRPGLITVLIGPNATGKSSVLQALLLLRQSSGNPSFWLDGPYFDFGDYRRVVHGGDEEQQVAMRVMASYEGFAPVPGTTPTIPPQGTFEYEVWVDRNTVQLNRGEIRNGGEPLSVSWKPSEARGANLLVEDVATFTIRANRGICQPFDLAGFDAMDPRPADVARLKLGTLFSTVSELISGTHIIPAIRGFSERAYGLLPSLEDLDARREPHRQAQLIANVVTFQPDEADEVGSWLQRVLALGPERLRTRVVPGHNVVGEMHGTSRATNWVDEAFGLNQLVHMFVCLRRTGPHSIVGIEEPEIHLHPRAQAALCDLFVEVAKKDGKQLILTTHSEHIAMGFLTAVARGDLAPDQLSIYEFEREGESARAERLEVNEYGQIEGGLRGFFEVDLEHLTQVISSRLRAKGQ